MNTINISGVGRLEVKTDAAIVQFAGGVDATGTPLNRTAKRVSRATKHRDEAIRNGERWWLAPVADGVFVLCDLRNAELAAGR